MRNRVEKILEELDRRAEKAAKTAGEAWPRGENGTHYEATEIVRKWAEEHPRKTRKDVLLEKFPNAKMDERGIPYACTIPLGITSRCHFYKEDREDCRACWNTEVEEE